MILKVLLYKLTSVTEPLLQCGSVYFFACLFNNFEQVPVPGVTENRYLTVRRTWGWLSEGRNLVRVYNCTSIVASCSCITVLLRNSTFLKYILSDFSFDDCSESPASR